MNTLGVRSSTLVVGAMSAALVLGGCGGGGDDAAPTATVTATVTATASPTAEPTAAPSASDSISAFEPATAQGFPEGARFWTFTDSPDSTFGFGAYSKRSGSSMCLIKMYPEYSVETGSVTDGATGQEFAVNERAETMMTPYIPPYVATVTGDPNVALTMTWPAGTLVLNATDEAGTAAVLARSNPGTDGTEALARIISACG